MNKKIYGLMAMGVATGFWACGSGDIMTVSGDDVYVSMVAEDTITIDGTVNSEPAKLKQRCPQCFEGSAPSSSSVTPPPTPNYSSSSKPANQSSSSERVVKSSSSGLRALLIHIRRIRLLATVAEHLLAARLLLVMIESVLALRNRLFMEKTLPRKA